MGRQEQRIKELVLSRVAKCGQCGVEYGLADVNVLGHKEDLWFLMLICGQCHQAVGVAAVVKEQGTPGSGDLMAEGFAGLALPAQDSEANPNPVDTGTERKQSAPVSSDDVAEVHDFLQGFDGDFKRLFGERV